MANQRQALIFFVAVALMAAVFAAGRVMPEGVAGGIFYVAVVLIGWGLRKRAFILVLALMSSVLVLAGHGFHGPPMDVNSTVIVFNHLLELNAIWLTAALLFVAKGEKYARQEGDKRIQDLKGAEKYAQDGESKLLSAIDGLSDGIVLYDADERFVMCNSKYLETRKALVKSLAELHQGSLEIESRPGRGTEVTVFFPKERTIHPN